MTTILLAGKTGQVGRQLQHALPSVGRTIALGRAEMDLTKPDSIRSAICSAAPDVIVNAAGYTAVDKAESEPELARQINVTAPGVIAEECNKIKGLLIHYSTDYVYDGTRGTPYREEDVANPLNTYGRTKLDGERAIAESGCAYLILRTSWIYSDIGGNFVLAMLRLARQRREIAVVDDQIGSPTWARSLAGSTAALIAKAEQNRSVQDIFHLSASGHTSRFDFAVKIIEIARRLSGTNAGWAEIRRTKNANYPLPAKRPLNAATSKDKIKRVYGIEMPRWEVQLEQFLAEIFADPKWRTELLGS